MKEEWHAIRNYEDRYQISTSGRVMSLNFKRSGKPKIMKPSISHYGYLIITLNNNGEKKTFSVHSLVAETFIANPEHKPEVNHKDGNKLNNCVSNLEWVTPKENTQHAIKTGLRDASKAKHPHGSDHYSSKPVLQYDVHGIFIHKWDCISDASRYYSCKPANIINCCKGRIKTLKGYIWRYCDNDIIPQSIIVKPNRKSQKLIYQYSLDGELVKIWSSYEEIDESGLYKGATVNHCCNGALKTGYGYVWKFKYI